METQHGVTDLTKTRCSPEGGILWRINVSNACFLTA